MNYKKNFWVLINFSFHWQKRNWFTLVELIIVISILAILATIAFVNFQWYQSLTRDSNRLSTLKNVESWVEIFFTKTGKVPEPDNAITFSWWNNVVKQWIIGQNIIHSINMNTLPLDPLTNEKYIYSVLWNGPYYQIATNKENSETSYIPSTYAENLSTIVKWTYTFDPSLPSLIVIPDSVWNGWILDSNVCFLVNWWNNNLSSSSWSCIKKAQMSFNTIDKSLIWYWDMESLTTDRKLRDLSGNGNDGIISWWISIWGTWWKIWRWTFFDWADDNIQILNESYWAWFNWFWEGTGETVSYIFKMNPNTTLDASNMVIMTRNYEMTTCIWTAYIIFRDNKWSGITYSPSNLRLWTDYLLTATYWLKDGVVKLYINWKLIDQRMEWAFQPWWRDGIFNMWLSAGWCSGVHFNGILDDVKIYNRVLTESEIKQQAKMSGY